MGPYSGSGTRLELGKRVGRSLVYFKNQLTLLLYTLGFTNTHFITFYPFLILFSLEVVFSIHFILIFFAQNGEITWHGLFWPSNSHKEGLAVAVPFSCSFYVRGFIWAVNHQCYCHLEVYGVALPGVRVLQFTKTLNMEIVSEILSLFGS